MSTTPLRINLKKILSEVKSETLPDLSNMDEFFLYSKIVAFMKNHELNETEEFIRKIQSEKFFTDWFANSLSFNETELFRDVSMWEKTAENIFPGIDKFHILMPISNTGLELYSMLILLKQKDLLENSNIRVQCFTQKDVYRIKQGIVSGKVLLTSEKNFEEGAFKVNLRNFFKQGKGDYKLDIDIDKYCDFIVEETKYNEIKEEFDLVFVRNKLMYFREQKHNEIIADICSLVKPGGYLVLGTLENIRNQEAASNFDLLFPEEKIFRKRRDYRKAEIN
ncbi:MAG: hypothetical protein JXR58_03730 [Bacteroidales bacterium]|nr:hypothetical protein [Bacteroidales bacterium]